MRLHARTLNVQRAHNEAGRALLKIWEKHDLTYGEIVSFHASELQSNAKYMIRGERHEDDTPDDVAKED